MISGPLAHVGGLPIEETLGSFGPALLVGFAVTWANVRARLRWVCFRASPPSRKKAARSAGGRV
jgi:hypothetical protein